MKKLLVLILALGSIKFSTAQQEKWKEMHDFHEVISATFHPAEENNLAPTRQYASKLVASAKAWKKSKAPAGYDQQTVAPVLDKLVYVTSSVEKAVKEKKSDSELKKLMISAHDTFHEIAEKCRKPEEKHK